MPGAAGALGPLTQQAKTSTILSTLRDMDSETRTGADTLVEVALDSGATEPLRALDEFTKAQFDDLRDVLPALPEAARPRARMSLTLLAAVAQRTVDVADGLPTGTPAEPTDRPTPTATLTPAPTRTGGASSPTPTGGSGGDGDSTAKPTAPSISLNPESPVPTIPTLPTSLPPILPTDAPTLEVPLVTDLPSLLDG
jgi:hypothetical protein